MWPFHLKANQINVSPSAKMAKTSRSTEFRAMQLKTLYFAYGHINYGIIAVGSLLHCPTVV